jgi:hypothetical protein
LCEDRPILPALASERDPTPHWYEIPQGFYRISRKIAAKIEYVARPLTVPKRVALPLAAAMIFFSIGFWPRDEVLPRLPLSSFEGAAYNTWFSIGIVVSITLMIIEALRLYWTWNELARLLRPLSRLRLRRTFAAIDAISFNSLWSMSGNVQILQYRLFAHQLEAAMRLNNLADKSIWSVDDAVQAGRLFARERARHLDQGVVWVITRDGGSKVQIRKLLARAVADVFNRILLEHWSKETDSLNTMRAKHKPEVAEGQVPITLSRNPIVRAAEEFVCFHYIAYIQNILARMRTMIVSMMSLFLAISFAIALYPFVPRSGVALLMFGNLIFLAIIVGYVYAAMARDETLSYITNTEPGKLGSEFWVKFLAFIVGPVIGLLTTQFPQIADFLLSWLQPGLEAIK